jgi:hypothetical protein
MTCIARQMPGFDPTRALLSSCRPYNSKARLNEPEVVSKVVRGIMAVDSFRTRQGALSLNELCSP